MAKMEATCHAGATKPLDGEGQCAIEVELHCLIGTLCRLIIVQSLTSWFHGYSTVVRDFPKISGKLSACTNSGYQALLSSMGWGLETRR